MVCCLESAHCHTPRHQSCIDEQYGFGKEDRRVMHDAPYVSGLVQSTISNAIWNERYSPNTDYTSQITDAYESWHSHFSRHSATGPTIKIPRKRGNTRRYKASFFELGVFKNRLCPLGIRKCVWVEGILLEKLLRTVSEQ